MSVFDKTKNYLTPGKSIDPNSIPDELKEDVKCAICGNQTFLQTVKFIKIKQKEPTYLPIPCSVCSKCKEILPEQP